MGNLPADQLVHFTTPVAVSGPLTDAQLRAAAVPVSGPLTDAQLAARLPLSVAVSNFPATQTVTGTVNIGNYPASQTVHVDNFPAVQPVSGSVSVLNFPASFAVTQGTSPWVVDGSAVTQPVSATALPLPTGAAKDSMLTDGSQRVGGTVTVSGAVTVGNFPASYSVTQGTSPWVIDGSGVVQPVSGPLTDTQLRASRVQVDGSGVTQPVSVATLPLPDGAATEETLDRAADSLDDVGLTAILERDKIAP